MKVNYDMIIKDSATKPMSFVIFKESTYLENKFKKWK